MNFITKYRLVIGTLLFVGGVVSLPGCGNVREAAPNNEPALPAAIQEYKIGVGDQLQVNVWRNPELSVTVPVRPDGKISTPLAGDIVAAGVTAEQLAKDITKALDAILKNPKVTVIVSMPSSTDFQRRVRITGAVNNPQSIAFREGMTVLDLVLLAGGANDFASLKKAKLYRKTATGVQVYNINLDDILIRGIVEQNYTLQPSDHITVPERRF